MTNNEKELVAALEADIEKWAVVAKFFEHLVNEIEEIGGDKISGRDFARGLRLRIAENRALIERVTKG